MPLLYHSTKAELLDLLTPLFESPQDRRAVLAFALGNDQPALALIDWDGPVHPFLLNLLAQLDQSGEAGQGSQAVWRLLLGVRGMVGGDGRSRIDAQKPLLDHPAD